MVHLIAQVSVFAGYFSPLDWAVVAAYFVSVSVLGVKLAGPQRGIDDFFRGGGRLPWYAVAGSMVATIVSAVTFVAVPAVVYRDGGDFTYLQLGLIAGLLSRIVVAVWLIPAYYRHQVLSPYDFIGQRRGEAARLVTTLLFTAMGVMAQAARVYLTAMVLTLVLAQPLGALAEVTGVSPLAWAVFLIAVIAAAWTMVGGIATVVWTDALLLLVFVVGGVAALGVIVVQLPGGWGELVSEGAAAGKFRLFDLTYAPDFTRPYTLWAAVFAVTLGNVGQYGTDQLLAQRLFCCRSANGARAAILTSWLGEAIVALMLLVGVGLWVFYERAFPLRLAGEAAALVGQDADNVFPVFILTEVPMGLRGLIVAGILAAAVSSLTSILAALAQTTLSATVVPWRARHGNEGQSGLLAWSRGLILFWALCLAGAALGLDVYVRYQAGLGRDVPLLDLALGLSGYIVGALFGAFVLAWLPLKINARGIVFAAPLSVLAVVAMRFHGQAVPQVMLGMGGVILVVWIATAWTSRLRLVRSVWLVLATLVLFAMARWGTFSPLEAGGLDRTVAWPWYAPIGAMMMLVFGYLLADRLETHAAEA
ncbi:MAG: hypothetical protein V3V20_02335 [Algisphaera sp.]